MFLFRKRDSFISFCLSNINFFMKPPASRVFYLATVFKTGDSPGLIQSPRIFLLYWLFRENIQLNKQIPFDCNRNNCSSSSHDSIKEIAKAERCQVVIIIPVKISNYHRSANSAIASSIPKCNA